MLGHLKNKTILTTRINQYLLNDGFVISFLTFKKRKFNLECRSLVIHLVVANEQIYFIHHPLFVVFSFPLVAWLKKILSYVHNLISNTFDPSFPLMSAYFSLIKHFLKLQKKRGKTTMNTNCNTFKMRCTH
jgi:hypothetical protein